MALKIKQRMYHGSASRDFRSRYDQPIGLDVIPIGLVDYAIIEMWAEVGLCELGFDWEETC